MANIFDHISKMCVVNDYILIASRNQSIIQVYSKKGNFLYQISNKGNGPKDYLEIAQKDPGFRNFIEEKNRFEEAELRKKNESQHNDKSSLLRNFQHAFLYI